MRESPLQKTPYDVGAAAGLEALMAQEDGAAAGSMDQPSAPARRRQPPQTPVRQPGPAESGRRARPRVLQPPPAPEWRWAAAALRPFLSASPSVFTA